MEARVLQVACLTCFAGSVGPNKHHATKKWLLETVLHWFSTNLDMQDQLWIKSCCSVPVKLQQNFPNSSGLPSCCLVGHLVKHTGGAGMLGARDSSGYLLLHSLSVFKEPLLKMVESI